MNYNKNDVSREGLTWDKALQPARLLVSNLNYALVKVSEFTKINIEKINEEMGTNIKAIILDVDECVAPHHGDILEKNIRHIEEMCKLGIKIIIFSNMKDNGRYQSISNLVEVHSTPHAKPGMEGFKECCEKLELNPEEVLMIGDNPMTDGGARRLNINLALVNPVYSPEAKLKGSRIPQMFTRFCAKKISDTYDFVLRRKVYTG
jgi:HAD superfamily phosphatase (TIGR01668 family)